MSNVTESNDNDKIQTIVNNEPFVILDFYAEWCGPCKALAPTLDNVSIERPDVKIVKINVDDAPALTKQYNVRAIPTLCFIKDGQLVATHMGSATKAELLAKIVGEF